MSKKYRVVVVGVAHMHVFENTQAFAQHPQCEVLGFADVPPKTPTLGDKPTTRKGNVIFLQEKGLPLFEDYRSMVDELHPDIAIVCCENAQHHAVITDLLGRGIHVVVEKPLALTIEDARAMADLAVEKGVALIVNWPSTWVPAMRAAQPLVEAGEIGHVYKFTYRNAYSPGPLGYVPGITDEEKAVEWWHIAETGGGAYLDYCCYGCNLARYFLGEKADTAWGLKFNVATPYATAEDNGVLVAQFPSGAVAMLDGSWTQKHPGVSNGPICFGSEGTLVVDGANDRVLIYKEKGKTEPTRVVEAPPLPEDRNDLAKEVIHHLETGEPLHPTMSMQVNLDAMAILDAGIRAAASGCTEKVK